MRKVSRIALLVIGMVACLEPVTPKTRSTSGEYRLVSSAEGVVGRPLTPVSVAGVTRRTVRRCAVGVYNC